MIDTILEFLVQKNYKQLKEFLAEENPADIAEVISELDENDAILVFRLLSKDTGLKFLHTWIKILISEFLRILTKMK